MSYILDALKKAEAQRKLGAVPSIHAQAPGSLPMTGPRAPISRLWTGLLAVLLVGGALVWFAPWQAALAPPVKVLVQAPPVPQTAAIQAAAPIVQAPVEARPISEKPAPSVPAITTGPSAKAEASPPKPLKESKAEKLPPAPVSAPAAQPSKELPMLHELPENIQREIPALTIGGYLYAANPSARSIVINNKFLREGDEVASDLILEKLLPKEAIFSYRGYRYRLSYSQNAPGR